ncbi:MAG: hypothetical protein IPM97_16200 [Bdellovibrionaceae bacterium]|nr:hypothetical protein [Pseudobdellovibrionaceae bacterium]OYZ18384.1 MAG: hypothetical protein B7Y39_13760 [Bdellovibrio sp. 28-41-41]
MNLDKLFSWITGVVIAFAITGKLDVLQAWIWRAQAQVVYASRTSTWGSPRFFGPMKKSLPAHGQGQSAQEFSQ